MPTCIYTQENIYTYIPIPRYVHTHTHTHTHTHETQQYIHKYMLSEWLTSSYKTQQLVNTRTSPSILYCTIDHILGAKNLYNLRMLGTILLLILWQACMVLGSLKLSIFGQEHRQIVLQCVRKFSSLQSLHGMPSSAVMYCQQYLYPNLSRIVTLSTLVSTIHSIHWCH